MGFEWLSIKNYKKHYICLKCQKGFKRASKQDMKHPKPEDLSKIMEEYYSSDNQQGIVQYIDSRYQELKVICPHCQNKMLQMHYDFEVPRQRDTKSWQALRERLSSQTLINYDRFIQWHRLALQKAKRNSERQKMLKQNLAKLERISTVG